jgi:hypothetical protein
LFFSALLDKGRGKEGSWEAWKIGSQEAGKIRRQEAGKRRNVVDKFA